MERKACCEGKLNKGAWSAMEDKILTDYISIHGQAKWRTIPINAGLKRCGKSCRSRWLNYLRPNIKRGNITEDEEDCIIRLHKLLGNRWSLIAGRLSGRTDNEIKNYWKTNLSKRLQDDHPTHQLHFQGQNKLKPPSSSLCHQEDHQKALLSSYVVPKATRCTKVVISEKLQNIQQNETLEATSSREMLLKSPPRVLSQGHGWALDELNPCDLEYKDWSKFSEINDFLPFYDLDYNNIHERQDDGVPSFERQPTLKLSEDVQGQFDTNWIARILQSGSVGGTNN